MTYYFSDASLPSNFSKIVKNSRELNTKEDYQHFLVSIILADKQNPQSASNPSKLFKDELIQINKGKPLTEKTQWGGVSLKKVDVARDFIQKLLVINTYGILGFEIHKYKLEKLKILEGTCLVLYSNHKANEWKKGRVKIDLAKKGDKFEFQPNDEHGIIALTECIIEETSTNHLDDSIFIFKADQV